jgi:hypothetical protein
MGCRPRALNLPCLIRSGSDTLGPALPRRTNPQPQVVWWCAPEPASLAEEAQFRNNLKLTTQLEVSVTNLETESSSHQFC